MRIIASGTVFASRPKTDAASVCFPGICALDSGRWIAGVRVAPAKNCRTGRAMLLYSDDEGKTWSDPVEPAKPLVFDGRPGVWRAAHPTPLAGGRVLLTLAWEDVSHLLLPMFNEATEGLVDMKLFTCVSEDAGRTWSEPRLVDCGKYRNVPTPITGGSMVLGDGRWAAQFEVNKHYNEPTPWQHASALVFSSDGGATWSDVVDVHTDPQRRVFCWDQRVALLPEGTMLDLFWTFDKGTAKYLNIHGRTSCDGGKTWGELYDTGVPGQPARPVMLRDGRIVMVYVDRTGAPVIKARVSGDGGRTWPESSEIEVHRRELRTQTWNKGTMQDAWAEMSVYSLGLPDVTPLPNGDVLAVFYTGAHNDYTDVQWARLTP